MQCRFRVAHQNTMMNAQLKELPRKYRKYSFAMNKAEQGSHVLTKMKEEVIIQYERAACLSGEKLFCAEELKQMLNCKKFALCRKCHTTSNLLSRGRQKKE